jgi:hypothetical protein
MLEIKAALDAAFAAYSDALSKGAPEEGALVVGIARYRAFFPNIEMRAFEAVMQDAREKAQAKAAQQEQTGQSGRVVRLVK